MFCTLFPGNFQNFHEPTPSLLSTVIALQSAAPCLNNEHSHDAFQQFLRNFDANNKFPSKCALNDFLYKEAVAQRCSVKRLSLISQNCKRISFSRAGTCNFIKKGSGTGEFVKFLRTQNSSGRLLLFICTDFGVCFCSLSMFH